jgi:hypothetical protein
MQELNYFPELNWYINIFLHLILMWRVTYWAWVGLLLEISYLHSPRELWICLELQIYAPFNFILDETIVGSLWLQKLHKHECLKLASALCSLCVTYLEWKQAMAEQRRFTNLRMSIKSTQFSSHCSFWKPWRTAKEKGKNKHAKN